MTIARSGRASSSILHASMGATCQVVDCNQRCNVSSGHVQHSSRGLSLQALVDARTC